MKQRCTFLTYRVAGKPNVISYIKDDLTCVSVVYARQPNELKVFGTSSNPYVFGKLCIIANFCALIFSNRAEFYCCIGISVRVRVRRTGVTVMVRVSFSYSY